jgi:hypothetical protein
LDDSLGRATGLKICNLFREKLGTQGRDFVSQKSYFQDKEKHLDGFSKIP